MTKEQFLARIAKNYIALRSKRFVMTQMANERYTIDVIEQTLCSFTDQEFTVFSKWYSLPYFKGSWRYCQDASYIGTSDFNAHTKAWNRFAEKVIEDVFAFLETIAGQPSASLSENESAVLSLKTSDDQALSFLRSRFAKVFAWLRNKL